MTLTYVPNYFDILPMYLVVLAMMPLVVALGRVSRGAVAALVLSVWGAAQAGWNLPAEPWSDRPWFFNPLGWQLVFFTGFAFMMRWLPAPPISRAAGLAGGAHRASDGAAGALPGCGGRARDRRMAQGLGGADRQDRFRRPALPAFSGARVSRLGGGWAEGTSLASTLRRTGRGTRAWRRMLSVIMTVGQQSLAVFVASMFFAQLLGVLLDETGRSLASMLWINATRFWPDRRGGLRRAVV